MEIKVKYKLWYANGVQPETVVGWHNTRPIVGDTIRYKEKFFVVVERVFNLNNEDYTVVHCEEKDVLDTHENYL